MRYYCFANWVDSPDGGVEPLLPENDGIRLVADCGQNSPWAIFDVNFVEDKPTSDGLELVPDDLRILLNSAKRYSPAMALACHKTSRRWYGETPSRLEFAANLAKAVRQLLHDQPTSPFRLAKAVVGELGYLVKGEYVWILGYNPIPLRVSWVSSDFQIYQNSVMDFDLDDVAIAALMGYEHG